ncbi:HHL204Cp [Eremothecium sinecaudum]|uniref:tRNA (uracil-O(2)-)-methyltransferase n=1 Tax=Eremothecium sinecaudum TaxID=45286 RepID=A0A0X8HW26_9SACH|nr:HHL204Cp [Eremothecium sinecaudum]AMD22566.1 HHL204Cp [Eremothecium sinecaudum]
MLDYCVKEPSVLGPKWVAVYSTSEQVPFQKEHFETAMNNVIKHPNVNSTVIMRADILINKEYDVSSSDLVRSKSTDIPVINDSKVITVDIDDLRPRQVDTELQLTTKHEIVRRLIPRNPYKDPIINQTCLVMNSKSDKNTSLIVYVPHFDDPELCPFYIPKVGAVGILLHAGRLSVHYLPFPGGSSELEDEESRMVRTARRLLHTAERHSTGSMNGYRKRVEHDVIVDKVLFQDTYIKLKTKYSRWLIDHWVESTNPGKHVFEDIAIAAFLIELWKKIYGPENPQDKFEFRDLGCGNGILCYILIMEGFKGMGIDARRRKSWEIYSEEVSYCLKEQVIVPSILLRPHPEVKKLNPALEHNGGLFPVLIQTPNMLAPVNMLYSSADLINSSHVNICEFPENTFIIGNHSDELTCWIPLLGYPFMVIPCCSHSLNGSKVRFRCSKATVAKHGNSMYAGLVEHVDYLARAVGWDVEKEMLRIPSTRNAALVGYRNHNFQFPFGKVYELIIQDGGADGWVSNTIALMKQASRSH